MRLDEGRTYFAESSSTPIITVVFRNLRPDRPPAAVGLGFKEVVFNETERTVFNIDDHFPESLEEVETQNPVNLSQ